MELEAVAVVAEAADKRSVNIGEAGKIGGRKRDDDETAARDDCVGREGEMGRAGQPPPGNVDINAKLVAQFDPLHVGFVDGGVVHDFVENHDRVGPECGSEVKRYQKAEQ